MFCLGGAAERCINKSLHVSRMEETVHEPGSVQRLLLLPLREEVKVLLFIQYSSWPKPLTWEQGAGPVQTLFLCLAWGKKSQ